MGFAETHALTEALVAEGRDEAVEFLVNEQGLDPGVARSVCDFLLHSGRVSGRGEALVAIVETKTFREAIARLDVVAAAEELVFMAGQEGT